MRELSARRAKALGMGGPEKVARQRERSRLTARERVEALLDPGTFMEIGLLAHSDVPGMEDKTPADGKVVGFGQIDGRTVAVRANDATVLAGAGGRIGARKQRRASDAALKAGFPIINLGEAGGARIPDIQGSDGLSSMTPTQLYGLRGRRVPSVAAIMGDSFGDPSWEAALADFVVQVKGTCLAVSSPRVLEIATSEETSTEDLGGWRLHARVTGLADRAAADEPDCFRIIREFLSYLPANAEEEPPCRPDDDGAGERQARLLEVLPDKPNQVYDMAELVRVLVDHGELFAIKPEFDKSVITGLARLGGRSVGIIANQPLFKGGAMSAEGCEKCTSFICLCDSYHIPLVFLHDTPGFLVGREAERKRMPGKIITFIQALSQASVPKVSVVVRKSYGMAYSNMCGAQMGADFIYAWPTADISFMAPEVAANVVYAAKLAAAADPEKARAKAVAAMRLAGAPWRAAGLAYLDDVIEPARTREVIIKSIDLAWGGRPRRSQRNLANWPTSF